MKEIYLRAAVYLTVAAGAFASGYYYRSGSEIETTNTQLKTVEKIKIERVVVRETSPDGTQKETVTETETNDKQGVAQTKTSKPDENVSKAKAKKILTQRNLAVTLQWGFDYNSFLVPQDALIPVGASAGYRLLDQVWLEGGLMWKHPAVTAGVRVEF
jgi:hypothetical protein